MATKDRPGLLRRALRSIIAQDYIGRLEICVVFDGVDIDPLDDLRDGAKARGVELHLVRNEGRPGLAGGRNTGIASAATDYVAFCDDDDEWTPDKLSHQIQVFDEEPTAVAVSGGVRILTQKSTTERIPPRLVAREDLLKSRVATIHPSTLVMQTGTLQQMAGPIDENLPSGYGEDYDFLLRLTELGDVISVQLPIALIHWDRVSHFAGRWANMARGLEYLLQRHPELLDDDRNAARMSGQIAFAHAADGRKEDGARWAAQARTRRRAEWRWVAATAVNRRLVSPERLMLALNRLGRGV